jgi:hypothetical protein
MDKKKMLPHADAGRAFKNENNFRYQQLHWDLKAT